MLAHGNMAFMLVRLLFLQFPNKRTGRFFHIVVRIVCIKVHNDDLGNENTLRHTSLCCPYLRHGF